MLVDLMKARRSIRKYQNRQVEKEKLDILLKSALLSPSSKARRPWEFVVVTDKEMMGKLSACRDNGSQLLAGAPVGIVVVADSEACEVWVEDASIAATYIQLAAEELGLGSCWVQVRKRFHSSEEKAEDYIKSLLQIPEHLSVECIIAVGYPDETKRPYEENDLLLGKIHYHQY